jgi:hypothetical protein
VPVLSEQAEDDAISLSTPRTSDNGPKNGGANTSPGINLLGDGFRSTTTKVAWSKKELSEFLFLFLSLLLTIFRNTSTPRAIEVKGENTLEPRDVNRISLALTNKASDLDNCTFFPDGVSRRGLKSRLAMKFYRSILKLQILPS